MMIRCYNNHATHYKIDLQGLGKWKTSILLEAWINVYHDGYHFMVQQMAVQSIFRKHLHRIYWTNTK